MAEDDTERTQRWRASVRDALVDLPADYAQAAAAAVDLRRVFHEELARAVAPRLNDHLKTLKQQSYAEKKSLSAWVNQELHYRLGLTVRCPRTGQPALLLADVRDASESASRFRLEITTASGKKTKTYGSVQLPELQLMSDPPRKEGFSSRRPPPGDVARGR